MNLKDSVKAIETDSVFTDSHSFIAELDDHEYSCISIDSQTDSPALFDWQTGILGGFIERCYIFVITETAVMLIFGLLILIWDLNWGFKFWSWGSNWKSNWAHRLSI